MTLLLYNLYGSFKKFVFASKESKHCVRKDLSNSKSFETMLNNFLSLIAQNGKGTLCLNYMILHVAAKVELMMSGNC